MEITNQLTDEAILAELGKRLARQRIEAGLTQARLAQEAGVGKRTLERLEAGAGCDLVNLVRILRALNLIEQLNLAVPKLPPSPIALLKAQGRTRQRVGSPRRRPALGSPEEHLTSRWKWKE